MATLIFGNITFEDGAAIIHEALGIVECETKKKAEELGELLVCNGLTTYVIPEIFKGEILLKESISYIGECVEKILADL